MSQNNESVLTKKERLEIENERELNDRLTKTFTIRTYEPPCKSIKVWNSETGTILMVQPQQPLRFENKEDDEMKKYLELFEEEIEALEKKYRKP